ncbi:hypothetical protein OIE91_11275 [Streptomyces albidoflavus]
MRSREDVERQVLALVQAGDVTALREVRDAVRRARARKNSRRVMRYMYDPVGWARDCIAWQPGEGLTAYQEDALGAIPTRRRVAVRGPHGLGKTGMSAIGVLWFATTREAAGIDWKVIMTASAWRHLSVYLVPELRKWAKRIRWDQVGRPPFSERTELLALNLKLESGAATPVASNKPELIEGAHADSLLYLVDEAKIVPDGTWDAIEGAFSGGRTEGPPGQLPEAFAFAISTPGPPAGRFYDIHRRAPGLEDWWVRHVTLDEAIAAGRISQGWAEQRARQWGRDSAMYANRVLGEFHASDEDSVIPLAWVEAAVERWHEWDQAGRPTLTGRQYLGVDVARTGGDSTVLAHRHGSAVTALETHDKEDTMRTVARVQAAAGADGKVTPVVDSIGVGGGVVDRLRELDVPVLAYTGAAKATGRTRDREWGFRNCLTGDARVHPIGGLRRIYRSWHEGPMFKVETASGDKFTATPNHQVLTRRGWVTVQSLRVGDQLLNAARRDTAHAGVRPEVQDMPPMLSEVYSAARRAFGAERVKGGTVDFHGDRPVGEVDVVTVNGQLLGVDPPGRQHPEQRYFGGLLHGFGPLLGGGLLPHALRVGARAGRVGAALPHALVAGSPNLALLERQPFLVKPVRLAAVTEGYAVIAQHGFDESVAHPGVLREGVPTFSASVAADDLLLVHPRLSVNAQRLTPPPDLHAMVPEDAANGVHVDTEGLRQWELCLSRLVPGDQRGLIHAGEGHGQAVSLPAPTWLDSAFAEDSVNGGPVRPELLRERVEGLAGGVPLDQVVNVERTTSGHGGTYVFTLETDTGSYRTRSVAHRNCRSQAYWRMRELLDPAYESEVMLPPDDELLADLTAPTWDTTTGVPPKIRVETKEDLVKRMGRSPDKGDAVVMAFAGEWMKAGAVHSPARPGGGGTAARAASRYARPIGGGGSGSGGRGR